MDTTYKETKLEEVEEVAQTLRDWSVLVPDEEIRTALVEANLALSKLAIELRRNAFLKEREQEAERQKIRMEALLAKMGQ
jgi:hypothetical protein